MNYLITRHCCHSILICLLALNVIAQEKLLIRNVQYLSQDGKSFINGDVFIENGIIKKLSDRQELEEQGTILDGQNQYLVPGLIDAHIHLFQSGGIYTRPDAIDLTKYRPYEDEIKWLRNHATDFLQRYLRCGITSVLDAGGPLSNYDIRNENQNSTNAASLFTTGPLISTYQPPAFKIDDPPIIKVNSAAEAIELVQKQIPLQPDFIKIWYIILPGQSAESTYEIVESTIKESHANNIRVAVHATQLNTAKLALKAGADILVHSVDDHLVDQDFIDLMHKNDAVYIPTLLVSGNYGRAFTQTLPLTNQDFHNSHPMPLGSLGDLKHLDDGQLLERLKKGEAEYEVQQIKKDATKYKNLKLLIENGCKVATGTDAGNIGTLHASSFFPELLAMQKAGLTNQEIIRASTFGGAQAVGKVDELGSIEIGKQADLVLLPENPLEDLNAITNISHVIKQGHPYRTDTLIKESPENLVQQQLNGYNARNIDAFLAPYSDDIELYNFPNEQWAKGKDAMRTTYQAMFDRTPKLHCELVNRMVQGNTVIDQERVTGFGPEGPIEALAIYKIENGKIAKVYFVQ